MLRALILLGLLLPLSGCAAWRAVPEIAVAPDPVVYPAPSDGARYRPWASLLDSIGSR
jgi:hypothetical protein